ncbi:TOTE conflict system archaeo-eukaryotic primase domain-containing protein [Streptomyces glomeratus]|uniref:TOTE conflict system primase domain-containing protein n=1 Tax=Streptomyces glomeratus TaxID=284452 RepID=A0ABP6L1P3_9ACTN|nr:hypothetical protein [Streptomyces glomeratus]MCF1512635.1 hypothetical protein [Streptomyces glomeratus]
MEDWTDCLDPDELRIRFDVVREENAELREEIARLRADNTRLCSLLGRDAQTVPVGMPPVSEPVPAPPPASPGGLPYADASSSAEAKIALFRAKFAGREDVYAKRWVSAKSGRTGWSPAEDNPVGAVEAVLSRVQSPSGFGERCRIRPCEWSGGRKAKCF